MADSSGPPPAPTLASGLLDRLNPKVLILVAVVVVGFGDVILADRVYQQAKANGLGYQ